MSSVANIDRTLRIVVAEDQPDMRAFYEAALPKMGHQVVASAQNGLELVKLCDEHKPDLVVADIAMPIMDGIEATDKVCQTRPVATVLVSAHYDKRLIQRAQLEYVMAYLVKPITEVDLQTAIAIAMMRFEQFELLQQEAKTPRQAMNDRTVLERAKVMIMQSTGLDETDAFRRLQKMAWQQKRRMVEVAELMLAAANVGGDRQVIDQPPSTLYGKPLTASELEVIQLAAKSFRNKDIGDRLGLAGEDVESYKSTAMAKLGLHGKAELVEYARDHRWL